MSIRRRRIYLVLVAAGALIAPAVLLLLGASATPPAAAQPPPTASQGGSDADVAATATPAPPPPPPPAPPPSTTPRAADAGLALAVSCLEHVPKGATAPELTVTFPEEGLSGYEVRLTVVLKHGAGETVLPEGFRLQRNSDAATAIEAAHFRIPDIDGGSPPRLETKTENAESTTTLVIPFLALPPELGRHELVLPPVPISVARANGEVMTVCTPPQHITIDDPIADEPDPQVKPNPPPRRQREPWPLAKQLFFGALATIALAILLAYLFRWWRSRPKVVPPKPRVLPWIWAMQELARIRQMGLIDTGELADFYDQVDDCIRKYLGDRYGFDGLESTSEEIRTLLVRVQPKPPNLDGLFRFLEDSDLVKFADVQPSREDCEDVIVRAERIVSVTTPQVPFSGEAAPPERRAA